MIKKRLISPQFFMLRTFTAAGAFFAGFIQTFVFARVLSQQQFSLFILVAAVGYTLWLCDFGIVKVLFVRLRAWHLAGGKGKAVPRQANAIVVFYSALVALGTLLCFLVMAMRSSAPTLEAVELALFFAFIALNLVWFALRNITIAVDEYVFFELLEALRRIGNIVILLLVLIGLSFTLFLIAINLVWSILLSFCLARMIRRGVMTGELQGTARSLTLFFHNNRKEFLRSGAYASCEIYIYNFPYFIVPAIFGLGAAPIILDTAFKVFRGANVIFAAASDLLVPRQTNALAERDAPTLIRATLLAAALCSVPAAIGCAIMIFAADEFFAFLLGSAVTMPSATGWILVALLIANLANTVAHSLLIHSGFFKEAAWVDAAVVMTMTAATALAVLNRLDLVGFLQAYTAVYAGGALLAVVAMIRGPIRLARQQP